jgi:hypothetical protein
MKERKYVDMFIELIDFVSEYQNEFEDFLAEYSWESTKEPIYKTEKERKERYEEIIEGLYELKKEHS